MSANHLESYKKKRNLDKSGEPKGGSSGDRRKNIFVIQKHDASSLHYDFRLQSNNILVSWAVPKGLSTAANEKRLAVRTENHPLDYADFEGVIPEGEYGAGTVLVWDKGEYELIHDGDKEATVEKGVEKGALKFKLNGKKLKGGYAMARMRTTNGQEHWVIFKLDDEYADARRNPVSTEPDSVLTGRSLDEIAKDEGDE